MSQFVFFNQADLMPGRLQITFSQIECAPFPDQCRQVTFSGRSRKLTEDKVQTFISRINGSICIHYPVIGMSSIDAQRIRFPVCVSRYVEGTLYSHVAEIIMFQKQKMVLVCLPDSVAQLLVKAAQFILFEPGNGFRSCMKYFCESLFVCQLVHKFCPLVFIIPYRSHCLRRNLCLSVLVKILYISFHELLENSLCLRSHERFVHDVKTDDRLAVCVPFGQHPPHIDVMILDTGSIFGW